MRYRPSLHLRPVPSSSRAPTFSHRSQFPKALIIGINYTEHRNPKFRLKYCVDDAYAMAHFLRENFRFQERDIHILVDGQSGVSPTKANILNEMGWLVRDARPNDSLFFYFSGHAEQIEDQNGDEADGFDECICAMDYRGNAQSCYGRETPSGLIVDDEMHDIMVKPLPEGCRLTAIFDCCHSGTLLGTSFSDDPWYAQTLQHPNRARIIREKGSRADVISLSACKDEGTAVETDQGGALRSAFIECMSMTGNQITYCDLVWNLRTYMEAHRFMQRPQLSSSHKIDTNRLFIV
ncbi:peptidase C14, caspase domain-containing protein [Multifurca ochricompacta]|uniref:Peptidase C14, caspase domain-containing protein n=1 Tax=Multifurca ochricompacta TaxID=376703 RepID=A0AAD4M6Q6_9AGAM|nr:peptidase C14, caspase domain-containing protein [Multifurca ochricompacta]